MERTWYDQHDEEVVDIQQKQLYIHDVQKKYAEKKKRFKANIVELIIGIVLLMVCWNYLKAHPAERAALFSGFDAMKQKVETWIGRPDTSEKHDLERHFEEIIQLATQGECLSAEKLKQIDDQYAQLKALDQEWFETKKNLYQAFISSAYVKVKELCIE